MRMEYDVARHENSGSSSSTQNRIVSVTSSFFYNIRPCYLAFSIQCDGAQSKEKWRYSSGKVYQIDYSLTVMGKPGQTHFRLQLFACRTYIFHTLTPLGSLSLAPPPTRRHFWLEKCIFVGNMNINFRLLELNPSRVSTQVVQFFFSHVIFTFLLWLYT